MEKDEFILRAKIDELDIESHKIVQKFPEQNGMYWPQKSDRF